MFEGRLSCWALRALPGSPELEDCCGFMNCRVHARQNGKRSWIEGEHMDDENGDFLIPNLDRDVSINCLVRCSRSDYSSLSCLNRGFRKLFQSGEIYRQRRQLGIEERWIYFSCDILEWDVFDPVRKRWMHLPQMPPKECFMCSDKESLAVGTELLVFGKGIDSCLILRYSLLTNSWSPGIKMNTPRCLFGSASLGDIAILAGGCDINGNILSSAELYDSGKGTWDILPNMNKPRRMCSGFFMDEKFYVVGGNTNPEEGNMISPSLNCGEEFDLKTRTWKVIENMAPARRTAAEPPSLLAVVNNELYAADYTGMELRKYDKRRNSWSVLGRLPESAVSVNGWGLAFRACGDRLIVVGGPRRLGGSIIELNSWVPTDGPPEWDLLASKQSGTFVYNCAVMSC